MDKPLNLYLWTKNRDFVAFNLGIWGDTSADLLERLETEIKVREANVVIINVGVNDAGIEKGKVRTDLKIFELNLNKFLEISQKLNSKIIFTGVLNVNAELTLPVVWAEDLYYRNEEIKKYDKAIENFCQENNLIFIPMQGLLENEEIPDGVHPNAQGHEKIFQRVKDYLEKFKIL